MPAPWTREERAQRRSELIDLYVNQNKSIFEAGKSLGISYQAVFDRMRRLGIKAHPERKAKFRNKRKDVRVPGRHSSDLAEFVGILLGDGHVSKTQIVVTVNRREAGYIGFLQRFMKGLFDVVPHLCSSIQNKHRRNVVDLYIGSVDLVRYFLNMGLVMNKVKEQVDVPTWIRTKDVYMRSFLRGFFDTDGSVYRLKYGVQILYRNFSQPLLDSTRRFLVKLNYRPSIAKYHSVYITRKSDVARFFKHIRPHNQKHCERAKDFGII